MTSTNERTRTYTIVIVSFCVIVMLAAIYVNLPLFWIKKANKSINGGDLDTARVMFTRVIKFGTVNILGHEDDRIMGYYGRGKVYEKMGEYEKAIDDYDRYLESRSSPAEVFYHRGYCHLMCEDYTMATGDFSRYIEDDDIGFAAYFYRGYAQEMLDDTEMALENYMKACERGSPEGCIEYRRLLKEVEKKGSSPW